MTTTTMTATRTVRALLPMAVLVGGLGYLVWRLLERGSDAGGWLLAALLVAHGWVHLTYLFPRPDPSSRGARDYPFDLGRSWLVARGVDARQVKLLGYCLIASTVVVLALAALASVGWFPTQAWADLLVAGAISSTCLLSLTASPMLTLGFLVDGALVLLALVGPLPPAVAG